MWYRDKKWLMWNILLCSLLAAGFAAVLSHVYYVNHSRFEYNMADESSQYGLTLEVTKNWSEDAHGYTYGMQYDGVVYNYTSSDMQNWTVVLELVEGCYVDSYWNGEVTFEDNELTLECKDYNKIVQAGDSQTFGFVLYGPTLDNVVSGKVSFERNLRLRDMESFRILIVALIILVAVDITVAVLDARNRRLKQRQQDFIDIINQSFLTFANMIDAKDPYTNGHSHRVAIYSYKIADKMNLDTHTKWNLFYMALLHDIGKIGIPDAILKKNGKLTPQERKEIERHVTIGGDILRDFNAIEGIEAGARYHHEKYDGTGYAEGLKGKEIPLYARIIGVADAFDAMTSARCYRPKLPIETVVAELKNCAGTQFDPEIVPFMLELIEEGQVPVDVNADSLEVTLKIKNT